MTTYIVINGKEVTNPIAKAAVALGAILSAAIVTSIVVFVLLPIIGVVVTLSVGFIAIVIIAISVGVSALIFGAAILGWLFGPTEFRFEKTHKRK